MVYGGLGGMLWHFFCVISHICITKGLFFLCTNPHALGPVHLLHNLNAHKHWEILYCIQSMYWNTKCNPLSPYQHEATSWLPVYPRTKQLHASTWLMSFHECPCYYISNPIQRAHKVCLGLMVTICKIPGLDSRLEHLTTLALLHQSFISICLHNRQRLSICHCQIIQIGIVQIHQFMVVPSLTPCLMFSCLFWPLLIDPLHLSAKTVNRHFYAL